jgi:hypothetical protein
MAIKLKVRHERLEVHLPDNLPRSSETSCVARAVTYFGAARASGRQGPANLVPPKSAAQQL